MKQMKKYLWVILVLCGFASCADMLETNTNAYLKTEDNRLDSANDSLYSVVGILKQLLPVGNSYVLLGELRGDLTDVTENADMDMRDIADFTATTDNRYLSTKEYYAVINHCNYFLQHADTTIISAGRKVMLNEYVAVKAIRAWTYLQLGLNYGKAVWLTEPLLSVDDMNKDYEEIPLESLIERLIQDLIPFVNHLDYPSYGTIGSIPFTSLLIPVRVLMADLCLWYGAYTGNRQAYADAATLYYYWFTTEGRSFMPVNWYNVYTSVDFLSTNTMWQNVYNGYASSEHITMIVNPSDRNTISLPQTSRWCLPTNSRMDTYMIKPSQVAIDFWGNEIYSLSREAQKDVLYTKGDLRGNPNESFVGGSYAYVNTNLADSVPYITKYGYYSYGSASPISSIFVYRSGLLYLRYAEALNALGKPSLAFALLKYGLRKDVLQNAARVALDEVDPLPVYCDFMDDRFSTTANRGFHARGSGSRLTTQGVDLQVSPSVEYDTIYYAFTPDALLENSAYYGIPQQLANKQDSIEFVNVMICKELALETAFEGNRFHDLMRLSKQYEQRTGKRDFLARWVGRRNPALEAKLTDPSQWFLPSKP
jgi:hypothetical protein